jgi:hypothetical protein
MTFGTSPKRRHRTDRNWGPVRRSKAQCPRCALEVSVGALGAHLARIHEAGPRERSLAVEVARRTIERVLWAAP